MTEIIKADKAIASAVRILKKGGVIVYPTETAYGLGADATNIKAVKKIMKIKHRHGKHMPIIVSDMRMAEKYIVLDKDTKKLIKKFMPGPLTLAAKNRIKTRLLGGFRISSNKFASRLAKKLGKPITATSANISGKKPIYKISKINKTFLGKVDLIIDANDLRKRQPSTIYDPINKKILRKGKIKLKQIKKALS